MPVEITLPGNPTFIDILALGHAWTLAEIEAAGHGEAYAAARRQAEGLLDDALRVLAPLGVDSATLQAMLGERVSQAGLPLLIDKLVKRHPVRPGRTSTPGVDHPPPAPPVLRVVSPLEVPPSPPPVPGPPINPSGLGVHRFVLRDGRTLEMDCYVQSRTYAGVLCGYPKRSDTRREIENHLRAAGAGGPERQPILLAPRLTAYAYPPEGGIEGDPCEALPPVATRAWLTSRPVGGGDYSTAQVLWFQHGWGLPPQEILDDLAIIDWRRRAVDEMI